MISGVRRWAARSRNPAVQASVGVPTRASNRCGSRRSGMAPRRASRTALTAATHSAVPRPWSTTFTGSTSTSVLTSVAADTGNARDGAGEQQRVQP